MAQALRKKDIEDAKKISTIFSTLSEESKTIAVVYLSALRDKEMADGERARCAQWMIYKFLKIQNLEKSER